MPLQEELQLQGNKLFRWRGTLPIIIILVGLTVYFFEVRNPQSLIPDEWYFSYQILCLVICFLGLLVRILTVGFAAKNTSGRNKYAQLADELNSTGAYSLVRHPLYLGNFLMWLGPAMLTQNLWFIVAFVLLFWVYYERIMFAEEQFLRGKFGESYLTWGKDVPAMVPNFRNFIRPKYGFSWKKILKQEKNGFFAIFTVFLLFEVIRIFVDNNSLEPILDNPWFYGFIGSGVIYFVLKFLKNKTSILKEKGR